MDKILTPKEIAMLTDTTICVSLFILAKVCSEEEINIFFEGNKCRLVDQKFTVEEIDKHTKNLKGVVLSLKKSFRGEW